MLELDLKSSHHATAFSIVASQRIPREDSKRSKAEQKRNEYLPQLSAAVKKQGSLIQC